MKVRSIIAAAVLGALIASPVTMASPAFADSFVHGQIIDAGAPVEGVEVHVLRWNAADSYWANNSDNSSIATSDDEGDWAISSSLEDGSYSVYFFVDTTSAVYTANQGWHGEIALENLSQVFTVTDGVPSQTNLSHALIRNAGVVNVSLIDEAGNPITHGNHVASGQVVLHEGVTSSGEWISPDPHVAEAGASFDGVLALNHVTAGTYYGSEAVANNGNGQYNTSYLDPFSVVAGTTNTLPAVVLNLATVEVTDPQVHISGAPKVGTALTATSNPSSSTLAYQWYADGYPIAGADDQSFTPTASELSSEITTRVISRELNKKQLKFSSAATQAVQLGDPDAVTVAITGTTVVGSTVSATTTTSLGGSLSYQWLRTGAPVAGATGSSYVVTPGDAGTNISVSVTSVVPGHADANTTSAAVTIAVPSVVQTPPSVPASTGTTPTETPTAAKKSVKLKATTDKTITTRTVPKVTIKLTSPKSGAAATAKVRVYYTKTKFKTVTVKAGKGAKVTLPKLKRGKTTVRIVYPGTADFAATVLTIKIKVS